MIVFVPYRLLFTIVCLVMASPALAADLPAGVTLTPTQPIQFVVRDAFVRDAPDNNATRIGQLTKGQRIPVAGKVVVPKSNGTYWLALKQPNGKIGFVFGTALLPMIDGTLKAPLNGKLTAADRPDCRYVVSFEGRTQVADDIQQTADYDIAFDCKMQTGTPLTFNAGMFITELPFEEKREVHQINIDLWDVRVNGEDILSVTALYDPASKRVTFDRGNDEALSTGRGIAAEPAVDVPAALAAALKIAHKSWQPSVWERLSQIPKSDAEPPSNSD